MKVCFFNTNIAWGGGEKWHYDMSKALSENGFEVSAIVHPLGNLCAKLKGTDIQFYPIKIGNLSFLNPFKRRRVKYVLKVLQPDAVILNLPGDLKTGGIMAKKLGIPKIIYRRGSAIPVKNSRFNRYLFGKVITGVIANSEATKDTILQNNPNLFPKEKIKVIYNGIRVDDYIGEISKSKDKKDANGILIGNLGRMVYQKSQKDLIDIAFILQQAGIDFRIVIGGEGPLKEDIEKYAQEKSVYDKLVFLGFVGDVPAFMTSIDVFVLPSRWEGFGYVLVEAMASGKPVIAYNLSSNTEVVNDTVTGFLVEEGNCQSVANKIIELSNDKKLLKSMGNEAQKYARNNFDIQSAIQNLIDYLTNPVH